LNVRYPLSLHNFFNFLECYLYKINNSPVSSVSALHVNITNFCNASDEEEEVDAAAVMNEEDVDSEEESEH